MGCYLLRNRSGLLWKTEIALTVTRMRIAISELKLTTATPTTMNFTVYFSRVNKLFNVQYLKILRSRALGLGSGDRQSAIGTYYTTEQTPNV